MRAARHRFQEHASQPTLLNIDLSQCAKGYLGTVTFTVSATANGTVTLLADGHTARFVPTVNFAGRGSYNFTVSDGVSTMTQTLGVLVSSTSPPANVVWYGDGGGNAWDTSTANWLAPNKTLIAFGAGDGASFDDMSSTNPAVNLSGSLAPSEILINLNQNNFTFAGTGALTGGTLTMFSNSNNTDAGTLPNALIVNTSGTLNTATRCLLTGTLAGGGVLNYNTAYVRTSLAGDWSAFTGRINVAGGGNFRITPNYYYPGFPLAAVNLGDNVFMYFAGIVSNTGTSVPIGELSGNASSSLAGGPSTSGSRPFAWIVGGKNTSATFAGTITEQSASVTATSIIKVGTGTWTLGGTSSFNGDLLLQQGSVLLGGSVTNGDSVEAQGATTLQLSGGTINTATVQIDAGATLSGCGTINGSLSNQGTVLISCSNGLTVNGDVQNDGTVRLINGSALTVSGQFTNTGVLDLISGAQSLPANFVNTGVVLDSNLVRVQTAALSAGGFTVTALGYAGHGYQLQKTAALETPSWRAIGSLQSVPSNQTAPSTLTFQDTAPAGSRGFYRIVVSP